MGNYGNEVGFAKIVFGDKILIPTSYKITNKKSDYVAGAVVVANSKDIEKEYFEPGDDEVKEEEDTNTQKPTRRTPRLEQDTNKKQEPT